MNCLCSVVKLIDFLCRTDSKSKKDPRMVYAGVSDLGDSFNRRELAVARTFAHPDYDFPNHDIAILEVLLPTDLVAIRYRQMQKG